MKTDLVKGFKDFVGEDAQKREEIRKVLVETFEAYCFEPAETPVVEYEAFVKGNNSNDDAVSDIFRLKDKGKRKLALRYEFTFQLKRIADGKKLPYRRYQIGPVFRDEPVSSNRFRQFTQCDIDIVGSTVKEEAEILAVAYEILKKLNLSPLILINNRELMNEILDDNNIKMKDREFVLREIDKYDKINEGKLRNNLKRFKAENVLDSLKKGEKYFAQFSSYKKIISLKEYCKAFGVPVVFAPSVVRGLSYYNGSVFEIKSKKMKETLAAGGSYFIDKTQATGISFGLERLSSLAKLENKKEKWLVISLEQDRQAIYVADKLRKRKNLVFVYYGKPSKALEYANSKKFDKVIFVGSKEVKSKKFKVKDMKTGKEKVLRV